VSSTTKIVPMPTYITRFLSEATSLRPAVAQRSPRASGLGCSSRPARQGAAQWRRANHDRPGLPGGARERGGRRVFLEVDATSETGANRLYERLGFKVETASIDFRKRLG